MTTEHKGVTRLPPKATMMAHGAILVSFCSLFALGASAQQLDTNWRVMPAPNPDMTYMLQPNGSFTTLSVRFRTNELGFRDGPIAPKSPNMLRILCVGDSVTFGTGVTNEDTFPNVLERLLQQHARPGMLVDVINAGVSAYNARNIRGQLQEHLPQLKPDIVVYVFVENDLDDSVSAGPNGYLTAWDPTKPYEAPFVGDDFAGMWLIRRKALMGGGILAKIADVFDNQFEDICVLPPPLILGAHPEPTRRWRKLTEDLDKMKVLTEQMGASFVVYSFAMTQSSEPVVLRVREVCRTRGIPEATTMPVFNYSTYADDYSLGYDPHCNPEGHRLMAGNVWPTLAPLLRDWWQRHPNGRGTP